MLKTNIQEIYEKFKAPLAAEKKDQALSELYKALLPYSKRLVKKFLHQENDDLAHDTAVKCVMGLDRFAGGCSLATWFRKMVFHECVSYWRGQRSHKLVSLDDLTFREFARLTSSSTGELDTKIDIKTRIRRARDELAPFGEEIVEALVGTGSLTQAAKVLRIEIGKLRRLVNKLQKK